MSADLPPLVTFTEAQLIGEALHDHLARQLGAAPMGREDMGWGDTVQFVLRKTAEAVRARDADPHPGPLPPGEGEIEGAPV